MCDCLGVKELVHEFLISYSHTEWTLLHLTTNKLTDTGEGGEFVIF